MPSVFISYTHADKPIARRVARRLTAYGISVWLDERELRLGSALEPTIERHINDCDVLVPIATAASARSPWVSKEIAFALEAGKSVCPLLVDPVQRDPLFTGHLGLDATDTHYFERQLLTLAAALLGGDLPEPDRRRLVSDVRAAASDEPSLSILVEACLTGPGLSDTNFDSVMGLPNNLLDYAINAMYDGCDDSQRSRVAWHAAYLFSRRGVGFYALERYARLDTTDAGPLGIAAGSTLEPGDHAAALEIIAACPARPDQVLANFIFHNASSLSPDDAATVVRLVSYPTRSARDATVSAALEATKLLPASQDLRRLWLRWIEEGQLDGVDRELISRRQAIRDLGHLLAIDSLDGESILDAFGRHIRRLARTPDRRSVAVAVDLLMETADEGSPLFPQVARELSAATGSAEWDGWPDRDEMSIYVQEHVTASYGDRDWAGAMERYEDGWEAVQHLRTLLDET